MYIYEDWWILFTLMHNHNLGPSERLSEKRPSPFDGHGPGRERGEKGRLLKPEKENMLSIIILAAR